jgi:Ca2+-binding RTX toxin-like protein
MEKRPMARSLTAVFSVGLLWPLVTAFPASAAACGNGAYGDPDSVTLEDAEGWRWDLHVNGTVDEGIGDAFDEFGEIAVGGSSYPGATPGTCTHEEGGREILYPEETLGGLEVSIKVYVPAMGQAFGRWLGIVRNATAAPVTTTYEFSGNYGSDSETFIVSTSSGDGVATTADRWAVTDETDTDGMGDNSDPVIGTIWDGQASGAPQTAGTVDLVNTDDLPSFEYPITVPAGGTFVFMHVLLQRTNRARALADTPALAGGVPDPFVGMSAAELGQLRNWLLPVCRGKTATAFGTSANDTVGGTSADDVVLAGDGNDKLTTSGGKDTVCAGGGNDRVNGGGGKDFILGETGNDRMNGGPGSDTCKGGPGKDKAKACEKGKA